MVPFRFFVLLLGAVHMLSACGTPPRTYGVAKASAPLKPGDRIGFGVAPGYVSAASTDNEDARNALSACVLEPLRVRFPHIEIVAAAALQRDLDASEPAMLREKHWEQRLADVGFANTLNSLQLRYAIELQDQSSTVSRSGTTYRWGLASGVASAGQLHLIRLQATVIDLANQRIVATLNGAAEGESKFGFGASGGIPVPFYVPARGQGADYVCSALGTKLAELFVAENR